MKVLKDRVLVSLSKKEETVVTEFGLTIPADVMNEEGVEEAVVEHVGPNVEGVEVGETVYIYRGAGKEIKREGKTYRVVSAAEVVVVL